MSDLNDGIVLSEDLTFGGFWSRSVQFATNLVTKRLVNKIFITNLVTKRLVNKIFITNLVTKRLVNKIFITNLSAFVFNITKFATNFTTKYNSKTIFSTNLALKISDYDLLDPKSLDSIVCYLDGVELTDINYDSLKIKLTKNSTPSSAEFELKRYYDKYDYKLDGTLSQISNKNKVEVYDGSIKLFTGYITKISCQCDGERVSVVAEDARYRLRDNSIQLYYGFYNATDKAEKTAEGITIYENTKTALVYLLTQAVSAGYISGYEDLSFGFIPEGTESHEAYGSLIDILLTASGNYFWYLDVNEKLCFGKLQYGNIKELSLNSETEHPHVYNIIDHSISLNKTYSNYNTALKIKFSEYQHKTYARWSQVFFEYPSDLDDEFTFFLFRRYYSLSSKTYYIKYITEGQNYSPSSSYEIIYYGNKLPYFYHISQQMRYTYVTPDSITIGTGNTVKTITVSTTQKTSGNIWKEISGEDLLNYFNGNEHLKIYADSYEITGLGVNGSNGYWEESTTYLCEITEEGNDTYDYILDGANFELSQNNNLLTEGSINLLLDAIEYFGINFSDRINVTNTKLSGIFKNSNGFPLNISAINIDCSNRLCTLEISNEGKSFYSRSVNANKNYNKQKINVMFRKEGT